MRRRDRQVFGEDMNDILRAAKVVRLGMVDGDTPYIVPMNAGAEFEGDFPTLYFHCAMEGRKLDILKKNPRVCFEADGEHRLLENEKACEYSFAYESVIGEGIAEILSDKALKLHGMRVILRHQGVPEAAEIEADAMEKVCIIQVRATNMTGKRLPR